MSSTDVPQDVKTLYKAIQALARRSNGVILLGAEAATDILNDQRPLFIVLAWRFEMYMFRCK